MRNCTAEEDGVAWLMRSEDAADLEAVWSRRFMVVSGEWSEMIDDVVSCEL